MLKLFFRIDPVKEVIVMTYQQQFDRWLTSAGEDPDLVQELESISGDTRQISDRFYRNLEFGTGGLRGCWGPAPTA